MKVLFSAHSADLRGGGELFFLELILRMRRDGYECLVLVPDEGELSEKLASEGVPFSSIDYPWMLELFDTTQCGEYPGFIVDSAIEAMSAMQEEMRRFRPDVVLTNTIAVPWAAYAAKSFGLPTATIVSEWYLQKGLLDRAKGAREYVEYLFNSSDLLFFNSEDTMRSYSEFNVGEKSSVIKPVLDLNVPAIDEAYTDIDFSRGLSIIVIGPFVQNKNQLEAVEGIAKAIKAGATVEKVLLVGDADPPDYLNTVKEYITEQGPEAIVQVRGFTDEIYRVICEHNVVIVPSMKETFGRVVLEGQLLGRLVVASGITALSDLIEDKKTGLLYIPGDTGSLADKLSYVDSRREEAAGIANTARETQRTLLADNQDYSDFCRRLSALTAGYKYTEPNYSNDPISIIMSSYRRREEELGQVKQRLEEVLSSRAFRLGNTLLKPARKIKGDK